MERQSKAWKQWLASKGIRSYKVLFGPDKDSIYPEFLPGWVRPIRGNAMDELIARSNDIYIETRSALINAKFQYTNYLYYKTDTHWNSLGAWVAFREFGKQVTKSEKSLVWLSEEQVHVGKTYACSAGDLAKFLRMGEDLIDIEVQIEIIKGHPIETDQYDFNSGKLLARSGNPIINPPRQPLLVKSKNALNTRKVLWLRDSFGNALSPFMTATFSETLQIHYEATTPASLSRLIDLYKPDYVYITVVERDALREWFRESPPDQ